MSCAYSPIPDLSLSATRRDTDEQRPNTYVQGRKASPGRARNLPGPARQVRDEVQLAAMQADGAIALADHIMDGLVNLDLHRRELAREDQTLHLLLTEIESTCVSQVKHSQRNLFNNWGL